MKTTARDYVPNGNRKIRAGRPDGVGLPSKGNRNSTFLGREWKDETPRFGEVVFGRLKDYYPVRAEKSPVWGGVSPDSPRADRTPVVRTVVASTGNRRRTPPPAGRRPSLSAIRRSGM